MKKSRNYFAIVLCCIILCLSMVGCSLINSSNNTPQYTIDLDKIDKIDVGSVVANNVMPSVVTIKTGGYASCGFVISDTGYILTNHHCVLDDSNNLLGLSITVTFSNGLVVTQPSSTALKAYDQSRDLAVIKITSLTYTPSPVTFAPDEYPITMGETAYTFGNPDNLGFIMMSAMIANPSYRINQDIYKSILLDCNINHGNSGGVLVNNQSQVIGCVNARIEHANDDSKQVYGIGIAIPLQEVTTFLKANSIEYKVAQ